MSPSPSSARKRRLCRFARRGSNLEKLLRILSRCFGEECTAASIEAAKQNRRKSSVGSSCFSNGKCFSFVRISCIVTRAVSVRNRKWRYFPGGTNFTHRCRPAVDSSSQLLPGAAATSPSSPSLSVGSSTKMPSLGRSGSGLTKTQQPFTSMSKIVRPHLLFFRRISVTASQLASPRDHRFVAWLVEFPSWRKSLQLDTSAWASNTIRSPSLRGFAILFCSKSVTKSLCVAHRESSCFSLNNFSKTSETVA
mmetsp:Transcript_5027/g.12659  ORF Transcript_5027/g.12659 Transcript_5027/m.12659 type:complete len:251 (+) Transcript_5027:776-1528(+)